MAAGDIQAGRAFVTLYADSTALGRGLRSAQRQLQDFGRGVMDIGNSLARVGGTFATAFGSITASLSMPIKMAGDMMETTSKFNAVFAEQAGSMQSWADTFSTSVGRARSDTMNGLAAFAAMFTGLGFGAEQAAAMAREMQALAVDFGSFHNVADPEAIQRFISALAGSAQVLDMYGISIREGTLNNALLARGFPSISKGATEAQKTLARMDIIRESMGRQGAIGDAIRTAGSFSNQMRALRAAVLDTSITIGNALLPVVTPLVTKAREIGVALSVWLKNNSDLIVTFAQFVVAATAVSGVIWGIGLAIAWVGGTITAIGGALGGIATLIGAAFSPVGLAVMGVTAVVAGLVAWMATSAEGAAYLSSICEALTATLTTVWQVVRGLMTAMFAGDWAKFARILQATLALSWELFKDFANNIGPLIAWAAGRAIRGVMEMAWKLFEWLMRAAAELPKLIWSAISGGGAAGWDIFKRMMLEFGAGLSGAGPQTLGMSDRTRAAYSGLQTALGPGQARQATRPGVPTSAMPLPSMPNATTLARAGISGAGINMPSGLGGPRLPAETTGKLTGIAGRQLMVLQGIYQRIDRPGLAYT